MTDEEMEMPLSREQISRLKERWLSEVGPLTIATCHDCPAMLQNRCSLQWDQYNTQGDCLAEK